MSGWMLVPSTSACLLSLVCMVMPAVNLTSPGMITISHHQSPPLQGDFWMVEFALVPYYSPMYSFKGGLSAHTSS